MAFKVLWPLAEVLPLSSAKTEGLAEVQGLF